MTNNNQLVVEMHTAWFDALTKWQTQGVRPGSFTAHQTGFAAGYAKALDFAMERVGLTNKKCRDCGMLWQETAEPNCGNCGGEL